MSESHWNRLHGPRSNENPQRDDRDNGGPNVRDSSSSQQNGTSDRKSDRLPSMNSLATPIDITSSRNGQDDGTWKGLFLKGRLLLYLFRRLGLCVQFR